MARGARSGKLLIQPMRTDSNTIADVPLQIKLAAGQTGKAIQIVSSTGAEVYSISAAGAVSSADTSAIGLFNVRVAHAKYSFAVDGGVTGLITPVSTATIPIRAIIIGATLNSSTAVVGTSSTLAVGTSAGSAANSIKTATAEAALSANALVNGTVTLAAPVKMSAAGVITVTVGTADLTAGVVEIFVYYVVSGT